MIVHKAEPVITNKNVLLSQSCWETQRHHISCVEVEGIYFPLMHKQEVSEVLCSVSVGVKDFGKPFHELTYSSAKQAPSLFTHIPPPTPLPSRHAACPSNNQMYRVCMSFQGFHTSLSFVSALSPEMYQHCHTQIFKTNKIKCISELSDKTQTF